MDLINFFSETGKQFTLLIPLIVVVSGFLDSFAFIGLFVNGLLLFSVSLFFYTNNLITIEQIMIFAFIGIIIGDQSDYLIGKLIGMKAFDIWPLKYKKKWLPKGEEIINKYGFLGVILGRFITPLRSITPMACAILKMRYKKFLTANILSCLTWTVVWSYVLKIVSEGGKILWISLPKL